MTKTTTVADWVTLTDAHLRESRHRKIHTAGDHLTRQLLADLPGYLGLRAALRRLVDFDPQPVTPVSPTDTLTARLLELAHANKAIPSADELADSVATVGAIPTSGAGGTGVGFALNAAEVAASRMVGTARDDAITQVLHDLDAAIDAGATRFLAGVNEQLVELVAQAREVLTGRGRIVDAEDAIAQGRVEEFQAHRDLGQAYGELRRAYVSWFPVACGGQNVGQGPDAWVYALFNPTDALGSDVLRLLSGRPYPKSDDEAAWRSNGLRAFPWPPDWDSADALWWFAAYPAAQPWAPSATQVVQAQQGLNTLLSQFAIRGRRVPPKATA